MTHKPYTVIVVPFPFTDSPRTKKRPAIVFVIPAFAEMTLIQRQLVRRQRRMLFLKRLRLAIGFFQKER